MNPVRFRTLVPLALCILAFAGNNSIGSNPQVIYGTYLGGSDKECAKAIAVDDAGNAYVVGRTPSRDFPVTRGAFCTRTQVNNNDWTGFVSKISPNGGRLLYSSFLGGNFRSTANAVAVDARGLAYVVGSTCSANFPTTPSAALPKAPGSDKSDVCDGFVAALTPEGSGLAYGSYLGGTREDAATAVALSPDGTLSTLAVTPALLISRSQEQLPSRTLAV